MAIHIPFPFREPKTEVEIGDPIRLSRDKKFQKNSQKIEPSAAGQ
jgi:hypothetical protein